jgi:hypothetical protein
MGVWMEPSAMKPTYPSMTQRVILPTTTNPGNLMEIGKGRLGIDEWMKGKPAQSSGGEGGAFGLHSPPSAATMDEVVGRQQPWMRRWGGWVPTM